MTKKTAAKKAAVKKSSNISCPVLKKILSFSPEELNERSRLKRMKKKEKREKAKLRKAEDQSRAEEEAKNSTSSSTSSSSNGEAAAVVTVKKKKQLPPPPKLPVELLPYLHKSHSYDKDKVPASVKESFRYTGQVRMY
jgi:Na+-translocating ferredoxin:NAD+ oxidoreductase RnfC subunit